MVFLPRFVHSASGWVDVHGRSVELHHHQRDVGGRGRVQSCDELDRCRAGAARRLVVEHGLVARFGSVDQVALIRTRVHACFREERAILIVEPTKVLAKGQVLRGVVTVGAPAVRPVPVGRPAYRVGAR